DGVGADFAHAGFALQGAIDQPGAGGAVHAFDDDGDAVAVTAVLDVAGLDVLAVPAAVVGGGFVHSGAGRLAQAVVIVEAGVADPGGGGRAAVAAHGARLSVQLHQHRRRRQ